MDNNPSADYPVVPGLPDELLAAEGLCRRLRALARQQGPGSVGHALNVAATHAQDCYAGLLVAGHGGSPGI